MFNVVGNLYGLLDSISNPKVRQTMYVAMLCVCVSARGFFLSFLSVLFMLDLFFVLSYPFLAFLIDHMFYENIKLQQHFYNANDNWCHTIPNTAFGGYHILRANQKFVQFRYF